MAVTPIDEARQQAFSRLAGGPDRELLARFLKGNPKAPRAHAQLVEGQPRILITSQQFYDAQEKHQSEGTLRPNLHATFQRWFHDEPHSLRAVPDSRGRGAWYSATTAANFYRLLYSDQDYALSTSGARHRMGTSVNGWTEWAFSNGGQQEYKLIIPTSQLPEVLAWLQDPQKPVPLDPSTAPDPPDPEESLAALSTLSPRALQRLSTELRGPDLPPLGSVHAQLARFRERFPLQRLQRLSGPELLEEMHGRTGRDSLVYWLEFKADDTFDTRLFGSIRGGTAHKFVVYQAAEDNAWHSSSSAGAISTDEAVQIAVRQRDQLLAAARVLEALPEDPGHPGYATLQQDIAAAAPEFHHLAFFHKALWLYFPEKLDDYHSTTYQRHILVSVGLVPEDSGLYAVARLFASLLHAVRSVVGSQVPMCHLTAALNRLYGAPIGHWRIGTGEQGELWEEMRQREVVAIGWGEMGDLSDIIGGYTGREALDALKDAVTARWADKRKSDNTKSAHQIWNFYNHLKEGDRVYVAYGQTIYGIGEVIGPYFYEEGHPWARFRRRVRWLTTRPLEALSKTGLQTTVYSLSDDLPLLAQAARHLDEVHVEVDAPKPKPERIAKALAPVAAQLERKGQVILYGPPGTGKTYQALAVAEELVARATHNQAWATLSAEERHALKGGQASEAQRIWMCTFHPAYGYEDFVEGLKAQPVPGGIAFRPEPGLFLRICALASAHREQQFVLIIDEFNRGDAPRIFGELLTLLELDKRERVHVQLPLSGQRFTVPRNVRILATMNTADRSISLLDAALRRRFGFVEYLPEPQVLAGASVEGLSLEALLRVINERLLRTLGDAARNLQVGHAYLMSEAQPIGSVTALRNAVRYDLLPLLQEYCAEDPGALHALLGDAFYDRQAQRFRDELLETGRETAFVEALIAWDPDRLSAADTDENSEGGADEGEE
jgi:5-methylcytosine-specific restriction protein B